MHTPLPTTLRRRLATVCLLLAVVSAAAQVPSPLVMDMVHHNPGEAFTQTRFTDPSLLASWGYNAQVVNEFTPPHCALTFDAVSPDIFPAGSAERQWALDLRDRIRTQIADIHAQGMQAYYFMDIILLPKRLVEQYADSILDDRGKIDWDRPMTQRLHRTMFDELFQQFPDLDGFVVRTGENYRQNIPYHTGNELANNADEATAIRRHAELLNLLREEVCVKRGKTVVYRTWDIDFNATFGHFHTKPDFYLAITRQVEPHPQLLLSIKHTRGDYWRHMPFNPCLGIGDHRQIVEVQCQREYEGKGAYANYIASSVIHGFEEEPQGDGLHSLADFRHTPLFAGIWTWSRGGGWGGPYLHDEFWCGANAYVLSQWIVTGRSDDLLFTDYARAMGFTPASADHLYRLAQRTPHAILLGRGSNLISLGIWETNWTRDNSFSPDLMLSVSRKLVQRHQEDAFLTEKTEAVRLWQQMEAESATLQGSDSATVQAVHDTFTYGRHCFTVSHLLWQRAVLQAQQEADHLDRSSLIKRLTRSINAAFTDWETFCATHPHSATPYTRVP